MSEKYASYQSGIGQKILNGEVTFKELEKYALALTEITNESDHLEVIKSQIPMTLFIAINLYY